MFSLLDCASVEHGADDRTLREAAMQEYKFPHQCAQEKHLRQSVHGLQLLESSCPFTPPFVRSSNVHQRSQRVVSGAQRRLMHAVIAQKRPSRQPFHHRTVIVPLSGRSKAVLLHHRRRSRSIGPRQHGVIRERSIILRSSPHTPPLSALA
jgi:hypothetical protein